MNILNTTLTIEPADFAVVGILVLLEGLLSADNALVLALLVRHLPHKERGKALLYGLAGAFVFRGLGIFFAARLINLWWVCAGGAIYLAYLSAAHFFFRSARHAKDADGKAKPQASFWKTLILVEITDIVFAIDSILVAVALVNEAEKIWIVYLGGVLGLLLLRLAASSFTSIIERFPHLDSVAYALVGWAGVKLGSAAIDIYQRSHQMTELHLLPKWAFWVGFVLIIAIGVPYAIRHKAPEPEVAETSGEITHETP